VAAQVNVVYAPGKPQVEFACGEIRAALKIRGEAEGLKASTRSRRRCRSGYARPFASSSRRHPKSPGAAADSLGVTPLAPHAVVQAYAIRKQSALGEVTYTVLAADATGAVYGGPDLAEALRLGTLASVTGSDHAPFIANRGIKFNIPLDARTPSYSVAGDSAQQNIPVVWDIGFWHEFLDELARQRYNVISLWNLHPFPSMVRVPDYPDIALPHVRRTTETFDGTYDLNGKDMVRPSLLAHLQVVRKMTIEHKIAFRREVMDYANDRGISVYLFTWNIFVWGTEGKHGITSAQDNP